MAKLTLGDSSGTPTIVKIKEVPKIKFSASVDTWIGDVDENGVLQKPTTKIALNFTGATEIGSDALRYAFYENPGITSVNSGSVQSIGENGLSNAFYGCKGITSIDLSSLQSVGTYGMDNAFYGCSSITGTLDLSSLQSIDGYGLYRAFYGCTGLTSVDLSSLQSVGSSGLSYAFEGCTSIAKISFPSLTSVQTSSFGPYAYNGAFIDCTALTEIHFRADMQATIEAMPQYANRWGATNATIYFDL